MNDDGILSQFFAGLDEFDGLAWEVRVTFPFPADASELPSIAASLEQQLGILARRTHASVLRRIGPTTWVLGASTEYLRRTFVALERVFREVLGGPAGAIDITPCATAHTTIPRHEPQLVERTS